MHVKLKIDCYVSNLILNGIENIVYIEQGNMEKYDQLLQLTVGVTFLVHSFDFQCLNISLHNVGEKRLLYLKLA